ncbi:MAG: hypothetical protein RI955_267, partial [Bacteroidota bacterium]
MLNNSFEKAYQDVQILVKQFENNLEHYMSSTYSEA